MSIQMRAGMIIPSIQKLRNKLAANGDEPIAPQEIMPIFNAFEQFMVDNAQLRSVDLLGKAALSPAESDDPTFISGYVHGMLHTRESVAMFANKDKVLVELIMAYLAKYIDEFTAKQHDLFVASEKRNERT